MTTELLNFLTFHFKFKFPEVQIFKSSIVQKFSCLKFICIKVQNKRSEIWSSVVQSSALLLFSLLVMLVMSQCVEVLQWCQATNFLLFAGGCSTVRSSSHSLLAQFGFQQLKGHVFMVLLNLSLFHYSVF